MSIETDIIHTVGPINPAGASPTSELVEKLTNCYLNSLNLANDNGLKTIVSVWFSVFKLLFIIEVLVEVLVVTFRLSLAFQLEFTTIRMKWLRKLLSERLENSWRKTLILNG